MLSASSVSVVSSHTLTHTTQKREEKKPCLRTELLHNRVDAAPTPRIRRESSVAVRKSTTTSLSHTHTQAVRPTPPRGVYPPKATLTNFSQASGPGATPWTRLVVAGGCTCRSGFAWLQMAVLPSRERERERERESRAGSVQSVFPRQPNSASRRYGNSKRDERRERERGGGGRSGERGRRGRGGGCGCVEVGDGRVESNPMYRNFARGRSLEGARPLQAVPTSLRTCCAAWAGEGMAGMRPAPRVTDLSVSRQ